MLSINHMHPKSHHTCFRKYRKTWRNLSSINHLQSTSLDTVIDFLLQTLDSPPSQNNLLAPHPPSLFLHFLKLNKCLLVLAAWRRCTPSSKRTRRRRRGRRRRGRRGRRRRRRWEEEEEEEEQQQQQQQQWFLDLSVVFGEEKTGWPSSRSLVGQFPTRKCRLCLHCRPYTTWLLNLYLNYFGKRRVPYRAI